MAQYKNEAFLEAGDMITISHNSQVLAAEGFKSSQVMMLPEKSCTRPFATLFQVQSDAHYDSPLYLLHLLSGKYLLCGARGIRLTSKRKPACELLFKPIFRCQIAITRKVRVNEEVILSPADPRTRQDNLALVASPFRLKKTSGCEILIKRNEATHFMLRVINLRNRPPLSLSSLQVFQLKNLETDKPLAIKQGQHRQLNFHKTINRYQNFIQIVSTNKLVTELSEDLIEYGQDIYIRSFKNNKFLSIDMVGRVTIRDEPNDTSVFLIEPYFRGELTIESLIKVRHKQTGKYLSISPDSPIEEFKLLNIFQLQRVNQKTLRNTVFINELSDSLREELRKDPDISSVEAKNKIKQLLVQIVKYIYRKVDVEDFLSIGIEKQNSAIQLKNEQRKKEKNTKAELGSSLDGSFRENWIYLNEEEQRLMGNVGLLEIMRQIIGKLLPAIALGSESVNVESNKKEIADEHDILLYCMMATAGVCSRQVENTKTFIEGIRVYYEAIGHVEGAIESLYHIFSNNKDQLLALELAEHTIQVEGEYHANKTIVVPSIELLLSVIVRNNNSPQMRVKIICLLDCLCLSKATSENIYRHQFSVLKALKSNKLASLLLATATNDHHDLIITTSTSNSEQQLEQIIMWKNKYAAEIALLQAQLNLFASLCHNQRGSNVAFMKQIVSQEVIYRYLKGNLSPEFKQIFMRLLIEVYLQNQTPLNSIIIVHQAFSKAKTKARNNNSEPSFMEDSNGLSNRLMTEENSPYIEMDQIEINQRGHSKSLQKIQNLVLQVTKKSIANEIIDRSFYMNIKALKKFLELRILDRRQVIDFKQILSDFVQRFSSHAFLEEEKKNLMIEILKIFCYYEDLVRNQYAEQFVTRLSRLRNPSAEEIEENFTEFCTQSNFLAIGASGELFLVSQEESILVPLIKEALDYNDEQIYYHATQLLRLVQSRKTLFVRSLKDKIVIASEWTHSIYLKILKIISLLRDTMDEHKQIKGDNEMALASHEQKINQLLNQLNYFFYEWPVQQPSQGISPLTQSMFRELGVYRLISTFLLQNISESSKNPTSTLINAFRTCFDFLMLFIEENDSNLMLLYNFFNQGRAIFEMQDCGQAKLLYKVLKMPKSKQLMLKWIYECLIIFLKHNATPNPYALLSLSGLLGWSPGQGEGSKKANKKNIEQFVNLLLTDEELALMFFKVQREKRGQYEQSAYRYSFVYSTDSKNKKRYNASWPLYLMQLSKLLLMAIEHSSENGKVIEMVQRFMPVESLLLDALNCDDLLSNIAIEELTATLMKKEVILLFLRVHNETLSSMTNEVESVLGFIQKTHQQILHSRNDMIGGAEHLAEQLQSGRVNEEGKVITELFFTTEKSRLQLLQFFNPIFTSITIYYPFIVKALQSLSVSNAIVDESESLKKQIDILNDVMFRKFKDLVSSKLTHSEYVPHYRDYQNAIQSCEQIFRRKVGLNLVYEPSEDYEQDIVTNPKAEQMLFVPQKIQSLVGNVRVCSLSSDKVEKGVYQCFLQLFFSQKMKADLAQSTQSTKLILSKESVNKCAKITEKLIDKQPAKYHALVDSLYGLLDHGQIWENGDILAKVLSVVSDESEDLSGKRLCQFFSITNCFVESHFDTVKHNSKSIFERIKKVPPLNPPKFSLEEQKTMSELYSSNFTQRILKLLNSEKEVYANYGAVDHLSREMEEFKLCFEQIPERLRVEECLLWFRNSLLLLSLAQKQHSFAIFEAVVELLKVYCAFLTQFKMKYVSKQLKRKLELCWSILFHAVTGCCMKNMLHIIERQVWNQVNTVLSLDDSYERNLIELDLKPKQLSKRLNLHTLKNRVTTYVEEVHQVYQNSKTFYEKCFPADQVFPLLPAKAYYSELKKWTIAFVKEFKLLPPRVANQFLTRIKVAAIDRNIIDTWEKHENLIGKYDIGSVQVGMIYKKSDEKYQIAKNMEFQNAVDLCSIKICIQNTSEEGELESEYKRSRIDIVNSPKIQSLFTSVITFISDLCLLFISCLLPLCQKPKKKEKKDVQSIMKFFFTKIGRVQVLSENSLYSTEFLIRPECRVNKGMQDKFLRRINFISVQLKLESIVKNALYFILFFSNEIRYYEAFHNWRAMQFLDVHCAVLKWIAFILITVQNLLLIINSSTNEYFTDLDFTQPFMILQLVNMFITYTVFVAYFLKDVPLLVAKVDLQLARRAQSYGSNYRNYSPFTKFLIKGSKILFDPTMLYHLLYMLGVSLILYNKLFASLVLLDIFFQVPTLLNLLNAIWRPKVELLLAIVSFTLIQYFFSILMFFGFPNQTLGFCTTLGGCFGFVFVTTYKAVGGFVGYLFQKQEQDGTITANVSLFDVFEDIYVILIFQIFFALILSIIIDNFTQIRTEQNIRKQNLESNCIVCNLDRSLFNVSSKINFKGHIAINHSIWNYFYYYQYVLKKDPLFRNHFERQIYEKRNAQFLPNGFAKGIKEPQRDQAKEILKLFA